MKLFEKIRKIFSRNPQKNLTIKKAWMLHNAKCQRELQIAFNECDTVLGVVMDGDENFVEIVSQFSKFKGE